MNSQRVFLQGSPCTCSSTLPVSTKIGCLVVLAQILGYVICWLSKCAYKLIWGSWLIMSPRNESKRWLAVWPIKQSSVTRIWTSMWIPNRNQAPVELLLDDQIIKMHRTNYNMERQTSSARTNSHKNMWQRDFICHLLHFAIQTSNTEKVALNTFLSLSTLLDPETVKSVLL